VKYIDHPRREQPEWWSWSWPSGSSMEFCARAAMFGNEQAAVTRSSGGDAGAAVKTSDASRRLQRDLRDRLGL
jgi:hypothetical protein